MATAAATRPSGPVLAIPNYGSASPNRVKLAAAARSPAKSVSVSSPKASSAAAKSRQSCMCSPTNHPGSFRCSLHKEPKQGGPASHGHSKLASPPPTTSHGHGLSKPASSPPPAVVSSGSVAGDAMGSRKLAGRAIARPRSRSSGGASPPAGRSGPGPAASPPSPSPGTAPATTASEQTNAVDMP